MTLLVLGLDVRVKNEASRLLGQRGVNPEGRNLDRAHLGQNNFVVVKAAIDKSIATAVGRKTGERAEYTRADLDLIDGIFGELVQTAEKEVFGG